MCLRLSRTALLFIILSCALTTGILSASTSHPGSIPPDEMLFITVLEESPVKTEFSEAIAGISISITVPDIRSIEKNQQGCWRIHNEGITAKPGYPNLPAVSRWIRVPDHGEIQFDYTVERQSRTGGTPPAIFQVNDEGDNVDTPVVEIEGIWPPQPVKISQPMVMRGVRVVSLSFYPVQWDASRSEYIHNQGVEVQLQNAGGIGLNEVGQLHRNPSHGFDVMLEHMLVNPPHRDMSDENYQPGGYLVVADENAPESIQEFIAWKHRAGHPVELLNYEENTAAEDLKGMIQERYEDTGFEYLVLMGSDAADPPLQFPVPENDVFYDVYYAQLEGDDILPDVAVGTFNCLTEDNLTCAIRRALSYQSAPYYEETDWFTRAGVGVGMCSVPNDLSPSYTGKWVAEVLERYGFDDISTSYYADNGPDDPSAMVENLYNEQTNFILIRAHEWDLEVDNIEQGSVYPFHFLVSSGTISPPQSGAFNWAFRQGTPDNMKGPSAGFGHFSSPRTNCANALAGGLIESMFLFDIRSYGWARNYAVANLQRVMVEDGFELMPYYYSHWRYYGDPGQWCWIGVPTEIDADFQENIDPDEVFTRITVVDDNNQPVANALVCLAQEEGLQLTTLTDIDGKACFDWEPDDLGEEDIHVTITGKNLLPFMDEIGVGDAQWVITPRDVEFNDEAGGDGDGVLNAGEEAFLSMNLFNVGGDVLAPDLMIITIESLSPWVEVEGELDWEDGVQPDEAIPLEEFVVNIRDGCPDGEEVLFRVNITWDRSFRETGFRVKITSPDMAFVQVEGNLLQPGQQHNMLVTIENRGGKDTGELQARLESVSPFVTILQGESLYRPVPVGEEARQAGDLFELEVMGNVIPGMQAGFRLILEGNPGVLDTVYFTRTVGMVGANGPLGPDAYGYIALDDTDEDIEFADAPEYEWVEICPWIEDADFQGEALPIAMGDEDDATILVNLPFPFIYYGQVFNQVSVCSNGWIAAGNQTNLKNQQNWVMPGFDGAFGMLAVFWDRLHWEMRSDGLIAYYDLEGGRYIFEWLTGVEDDGERSDNIFEAIIYDPEMHPTVTGNSQILFQYHTVNNIQDQWEANAFATVGISSPDGLDGLTYTYWNEYPVQCAALADRRAILWTTVAYTPLASLSGQVVRWIDSTGVHDVTITTSDGHEAVTDEDGFYRIVGMEPGLVDVTAEREWFAPRIEEDAELVGGENNELNFVLDHGWIVFDPVEIEVLLNDEISYEEDIVNVANAGAAPACFSYTTVIIDSLEGFVMNPMEGGPFEIEFDSDTDIVFSFDCRECISGSFQARIDLEQTIPNSIQSISVLVDVVSAISEDERIPTKFDLAAPYPNPFNSEVTIRFDLPKASPVKLSLVDLQGRQVVSIMDGTINSGVHRTVFNAGDLPAGLYFIRMEADDYSNVQRVVLLR